MSFLFNEDKSKLQLTDGIKVEHYRFDFVSVNANRTTEKVLDLSTKTQLIAKGYSPIGIAGYMLGTTNKSINFIYIVNTTSVKGIDVEFVNTSSDTSLDFEVDVLWIKTT